MKIENLAEYIIPIIALVFYFVLNARKKKPTDKKPVVYAEKEERKPTPSSLQKRAPSSLKKQQSRVKVAPISATPLKKGRAPVLKKPSYAGKLLKGTSLRQALLTKEILTRPYD